MLIIVVIAMTANLHSQSITLPCDKPKQELK